MSQPAQKLCPRCGAPAALAASFCPRAGCGHQFRTDFSAYPAGPPEQPQPTLKSLLRGVILGALLLWPCLVFGNMGLRAFTRRPKPGASPPPAPAPSPSPSSSVPPNEPEAIAAPGVRSPSLAAPAPASVPASMRRARIIWSANGTDGALGTFANTGSEPLEGVTISRSGYRASGGMGFETGVRPVRIRAQWCAQNPQPGVRLNDLPPETEPPDFQPGEQRGFILDIPGTLPAAIQVVDRQGQLIPTEQVAPPATP